MASMDDSLHSLISETRRRNSKRMRFAEVMAVIFALLLWRTTWIALRPGLAILLAGQIAVIVVLVYRNARLGKDLGRQGDFGKGEASAWFEGEEAFAKWSGVLENGVRIIGLAVLAYGFWRMTNNLLITLAIGVVYPVSSYFGMMRTTAATTAKKLQKRKEEITYK